MMKLKIVLLLFSLSMLLQTNAQKAEEKIARLKEETFDLTNMHPDKVDDGELDFLKTVIGDRRIVFLGEEGHTDGSTLHAKSKVITYLHQEMDFDVLLIERGFYEVNRAWRDLLMGRDSAEYIFRNLMTIIGDSYSWYHRELFTYIEKQAFTNDPLILGGVDVIENTTYYWAHAEDLKKVLTNLFGDFQKTEMEEHYWNWVLTCKAEEEPPKDYLPKKRVALKFLISSIEEAVNKKTESTDEEYRMAVFMLQALKSFKNSWYWAEHKPKRRKKKGTVLADYYSLRDEGMAENLLWYIEQFYPNKKIIVSTSTYHISRNVNQIKPKPYILGEDAIPMGHFTWEKHKNDIYSIAFLNYRGKEGIAYSSHMIPKKIKKRKKNGLEYLLHQAGFKYGFLDISTTFTKYSWLRNIHASTTFNESYKTDWSNIYDGFFYIDEMFPDMRFGGLNPQYNIRPAYEPVERPAEVQE